jgi:hypothetical protein
VRSLKKAAGDSTEFLLHTGIIIFITVLRLKVDLLYITTILVSS